MAALAAYTKAVCVDEGDFVCTTDFTDVNTIVADTSGDYAWTFYETTNADDYTLRMFRFLGDDTEAFLVGPPYQGSLGPVMFMHTVTKDCLSWLTSTQDDTEDSIPKKLFDLGYDVWLACRRGTEYSREKAGLDLTMDADLATYFDFNTETVGEEDIGAFIDLINETLDDEGIWDCNGTVQIVTHGIGAGEVLAGLNLDADLPAKVSFVTNLAPCLVPTYLTAK